MSGTSKKLILVIIPVIVLLICYLFTLLFVSGSSGSELCLQQIQTAEKYVAAGDYEKAIVYYEKAIKADKTQETPYINLAQLYYENLGDIDSAISILRTGLDNAGTDKIKNALQRFIDIKAAEGTDTIENKNSTEESGRINSQLVNNFSTYTYKDYSQSYTIEKEQLNNGVYTVKYLNVDASFIYSDDETKLIDTTKSKPYDYAKPKEIIINDLDIIISGASDGLSVEDIENAVSVSVKIKHDSKLNIDLITFRYIDCDYQLECDKNGNVVAESENNKVFPEPAEEEPTETRTVATANIDVVFTVDVSGSMSSDIDTAKSALNSFIDALDDKDRAGLVEFNQTSRILCGLTTDKNMVRSQVSNLTPTGTTAMYTGLSNALNLLTDSNETYGYKMIVILSDGHDSYTYNSTYSSLINTAVSNNVVVYTVGIGNSVDISLLTQLANQTGGEYYQAADSSEIVNIFDEIQNEQIVVNDTGCDYLQNYGTECINGNYCLNKSTDLPKNTKRSVNLGGLVQQFALVNNKACDCFTAKNRQLISINRNLFN